MADSTRDQEQQFWALAEEWDRRGLSRRDFVRLFAAGAGTATITGILAACGGGNPTATTGTTTTTIATTTTGGGAATTTTAATTRTVTAATTRTVTAATTRTVTATGAAGAAGRAGTNLPSGGPNSTLDPIGRRGGRVTEGSFADAETMNGILSSDTSSGANIAMFSNTLLSVNPDNALPMVDLTTEVPSRENGGISGDGLVYTFRLRNDVKWHDGRPFTARDVV